MIPLKSGAALLILLSLLGLNAFGDAGIILQGGLNAAGANLDENTPVEVAKGYRDGFNVALLGDVPLTDVVHMVIGGGFENKGFTASDNEELLMYKFNYVVFPLMLSFGKDFANPLGPRNRLFFNVGVEPAVLTTSSAEDVQDTTVNYHVPLKRFDLGLCTEFGGEVPLSASGTAAIFGVGYSDDLTNADEPGNGGLHNYALKVFVGLEFDLSRHD